jgi:hypothetical protein
MADNYVIQGNVNIQGDFATCELDRLTTHFHINSHLSKGTICLHSLPGFHVEYDVTLGAVELKSHQRSSQIKESYSSSITNALAGIILVAIAIYAKFHLLKKINELSDTQYPGVVVLQDIIKRAGVSAIANAQIDTKNVNKSLREICLHIKNNKISFTNVSIQALENIQSLNDANTRIQDLKVAMRPRPSAENSKSLTK